MKPESVRPEDIARMDRFVYRAGDVAAVTVVIIGLVALLWSLL